MINKCIQTTILGLMLTLGSLAMAGGVGSGGGGTTVPDPSTPEEISKALKDDSRFVIEAWLNRQERNFSEKSPLDRAQDPLRKIFETQPGISQLMSNTAVELRMTEPCYDSANQPVDGSIYGTEPGSICMSPFSMAPKLSNYNYKAEVFALLVHEFSHLMGTNENEAVAIQKMALKDFLAKDSQDLKQEMVLLNQSILLKVTALLDSWVPHPEILKDHSERFYTLLRSYQDIESEYNSDFSRYLLVSSRDESYVGAEYVRFTVLDSFVCSQDQTLGAIRQNACRDTLNQAFRGASSATIETIANNLGLHVNRLTPEVAKTITVLNPTSWEILGQELSAARSTFLDINMNLENRINYKISTY